MSEVDYRALLVKCSRALALVEGITLHWCATSDFCDVEFTDDELRVLEEIDEETP